MKKRITRLKYQLEQNFLDDAGEIRDTVWSDSSSSKRAVREHHKQLLKNARKGAITEKILFTLHTLGKQGEDWETRSTETLESHDPGCEVLSTGLGA